MSFLQLINIIKIGRVHMYLEQTINEKLNNLNTNQLNLFLQIIQHLNSQDDYFMSNQKHLEFVNLYYNTPNNHNPYTTKSFIQLLINETQPIKLYHILFTIECLEENYNFETIIHNLYKHKNDKCFFINNIIII